VALAAGCARKLPPDVQADMKAVSQMRELLVSKADGAGSAVASTANPTGFATFTGTFRIDGPAPVMQPVRVSGDNAGYCAPGGQAPLSDEVVVGSDGGLANVLIYLDMSVPADWEHPDHVATREAVLAGPAGFDQKGCMFLSHVFAMRSTQTVELINSDDVGHNTNVAATGKAKTTNELIPAHSKSPYTPGGGSRGPFLVTCNIHPWMKAYMIVRDNPYFAVTDKNGRFEIKNVPAGVELGFRVWQERIGNNWRDVSVNGAPATWSKGKFSLNLQPDATESWEVVVNASIFEKR
jgi:hypothetical protein